MCNSKHWQNLPSGFTVRPTRKGDIEKAVELFNLCSMSLIGEKEFVASDTLNEWETPNFDLAESTRVVLNNRSEIVGFTEVWDISSPAVHPFLWGRVHPKYENSGIGSEMLKWSIDRSRHVIKRVPEDARVTARAFSISTHEPSRCLLESHGL